MMKKEIKSLLKKVSLVSSIGLTLINVAGCQDLNKIASDVKSLEIFKQNGSSQNIEVDQNLQELIDEIEIAEPYEKEYDRDQYTSSSQHYEFNGESFTSIRSFAYYASIHYDELNDSYLDPYNGENINNVKSTDYDHIIPLHYANQHGADSWTEEQKKEYADDPTVGVDANAHDNRAKGDKGPCEWLPSENVEDYCYTWLVLAAKWDLSMDQECMNVIMQNLDGVNESELELINQYK